MFTFKSISIKIRFFQINNKYLSLSNIDEWTILSIEKTNIENLSYASLVDIFVARTYLAYFLVLLIDILLIFVI